jgi:hypothetical protein
VGSDGGAVAAEEGEDPAFPGAAGEAFSLASELLSSGRRRYLLGDGEEATVKRLYMERNRVRLRAEDVRVQGRVHDVYHPPGKRA